MNNKKHKKVFRKNVEFCTKDIAFYYDMDKSFDLAVTGELVKAVESKIGALK